MPKAFTFDESKMMFTQIKTTHMISYLTKTNYLQTRCTPATLSTCTFRMVGRLLLTKIRKLCKLQRRFILISNIHGWQSYPIRSPNNANLKKHFTHIQATAVMIFSIRTPVLISKLAAISNQSSSININRQLSSYSRQLKTLSQTQQIATGVQIIPTCKGSPIATLFAIPLLIC